MRYISGELPQIGDVVAGKPSPALAKIGGIVMAAYGDLICVLTLTPVKGEVVRVHAETNRFELLQRSEVANHAGNHHRRS